MNDQNYFRMQNVFGWREEISLRTVCPELFVEYGIWNGDGWQGESDFENACVATVGSEI